MAGLASKNHQSKSDIERTHQLLKQYDHKNPLANPESTHHPCRQCEATSDHLNRLMFNLMSLSSINTRTNIKNFDSLSSQECLEKISDFMEMLKNKDRDVE